MKLPNFTALAILEHEADAFIKAEMSAAAAYAEARAKASNDEDEDEDDSSYRHLVQMVEGPNDTQVALVDVKGRLTNKDNPYNKYYGLVSYNQIRAAVVKGVDAGASAVMFCYDTPGGAVSGMASLASFIDALDIPTISYTDATMASAGLFLGLASDHVIADSMAETGSVGVVMSVMDYSASMKKEGVEAHIFRSGHLKQVGNPMEPLSKEGKAYLQSQVMVYAEKFFDYTAKCRKTTRAQLESAGILTGRTFIGEESLAAGLVDRIASFEEALDFSMYLATNYLDKQQSLSQTQTNYQPFNLSGDTDMKKTFSTQTLAAMAAGVTPEVTAEVAPVVPEVVAEVIKTEPVEQSPEIEILKAELEETKTALDVAKAALEVSEAARAEAVAASASVVALKTIIASQVDSMRIAMSLAPVDISGFSAESVITEFNSMVDAFSKAFPVGGIVPDAPVAETEKKVIQTSEDIRAINALSF